MHLFSVSGHVTNVTESHAHKLPITPLYWGMLYGHCTSHPVQVVVKMLWEQSWTTINLG